MRLRNVTLEVSPKPFLRTDDAFVAGVMTEIVRQWYSLLKHAESVSLLWWLGDGTDLLEYDGDPQRRIEWAMWLGFAHKTYVVSAADDPHGESIVGRPRLYRPNPAPLTYGDVRRIVAVMKDTVHALLGCDAQVGIPFDPGSEFCRSPFRYEQHPEMLVGNGMRCIDATARLHADPRRFAGFPAGLPEATPFGTFFGRQAHCYLRDLGFDYLWLSNSFGFGRSPYSSGGTGAFFDGLRYQPEHNRATHDAVLEFWQLFRAACPTAPVECRGTDFTVGMNLVNHATPYAALYAGDFTMTPPPNTPWPALTRNHGLALAGYLSQMCAHRGTRLPYRFYASDPWWCVSPWMDVFERMPHDIYLTTAVTRMDATGRAGAFNEIKILSIDTAWGALPEQIPDEIIPHLKRALRFRPDAPPPVVWVYPFDEYHAHTFDHQERIAEVFAGDLLIQQALNCAVPLSGVVTTTAFVASQHAHPDVYRGSVLVTPVPEAGSACERALLAHVAAGGAVLFYGATTCASDAWRTVMNLAVDTPLEGILALVQADDPDTHAHPVALQFQHDPVLSAGGLHDILRVPDDPRTTLIAEAVNTQGSRRVVAVCRRDPAWHAGAAAWVRGSSSVARAELGGRTLATLNPAEFYHGEHLVRHALGHLGWSIAIERRQPSDKACHLMVSRSRNGFVYAGYSPDDSTVYRLHSPLGAPILPGRDTQLVCGAARVPVNGWFHEECRVFLEQDGGEVGLHAIAPKHFRYRRRWALTGLRNATVHFFPETGCFAHTDILVNPNFHYFTIGDPLPMAWHDTAWGRCVALHGVTGTVTFAWAPDNAVEPVTPDA
jgi:hypothetical protein